jgi:hypothetical protein
MTVFVQDSFTDDDGTHLGDHAPETGGAWILRLGGTPAEIDTNKLVGGWSAPQVTVYTNDAVPGSNAYDVQADFVEVGDGKFWGLMGRWTDNDNYYYCYHYGVKYYLFKRVEGVSTELDRNNEAWGDGTFKLELREESQKVWLDAAEKCASADPDIVAAGFVGLYLSFDDVPNLTIDNFLANDVAVTEYASMTLKKVWWKR